MTNARIKAITDKLETALSFLEDCHTYGAHGSRVRPKDMLDSLQIAANEAYRAMVDAEDWAEELEEEIIESQSIR